MKIIFLAFFVISFSTGNAQKLFGKYCLKKANVLAESYSVFEIVIETDSTYTSFYFSSSDSDFNDYKNWHSEKRQGKIRKRSRNKYLFIEYDNVAKKNSEFPVKIINKKIIFYGYKKISDKKLTKGFQLKACPTGASLLTN